MGTIFYIHRYKVKAHYIITLPDALMVQCKDGLASLFCTIHIFFVLHHELGIEFEKPYEEVGDGAEGKFFVLHKPQRL